jgi:hypothetical protein
MAIKWFVPTVSRDLRDRMRREAYVTNEIIIRTELLKAQGKLNVMNKGQIISEGNCSVLKFPKNQRSKHKKN